MTDHLRNRFANVAERLTHSFTELTAEHEAGGALNQPNANLNYSRESQLDDTEIDTKPVMTFRDRTTEFSSTVKSLQSRQVFSTALF